MRITVDQVREGISVSSVQGNAPPTLKELILDEATYCGVVWANSVGETFEKSNISKKKYASALKKHIKRTAAFPRPSGFLFSTFILPFIINAIIDLVVKQIIKLIFQNEDE